MEALLGAIGILLGIVVLFLFVFFVARPIFQFLRVVAFLGLPPAILVAGVIYNSIVLCLIGILFTGCVWAIWIVERNAGRKRE